MPGNCADCRFFQPTFEDRGYCRNMATAVIKNVGGGGEYSSSADCFEIQKVRKSQGCSAMEAGKFELVFIAPVPPEILERERAQSMERTRKAYEAMRPSTDPNIASLGPYGLRTYW